ncbi:MAG: EVE domain-containing protein [Bacteroidetes bacterium]|jgi:predicted RNA-binding protein with PUA-like domain|nr:EVE domain-containing protein [Bacteroidota bacterium]
MQYWLMKSEPYKYSWDDLVKDGWTLWDGVRNYAARNNMREMKVGDQCFYYHSNEGKEIVGIAEVIKEHYPDPTAEGDRWSVVDIKPLQKFSKPVTLADIKADQKLAKIEMLRLNRLSVSRITKTEFEYIKSLGN